MQTHFLGEVQRQNHFSRVLQRLSRRFLLRTPLTVYLLQAQTEQNYRQLVRQLPVFHRKPFLLLAQKGKTSFSFLYRNIAILVLIITPRRKFLTTDSQALQGIVAHELMHLREMERGTYQRLHTVYRAVWRSFLPRIKQLRHPGAVRVLKRVGAAAELLLKDLYVNSTLIQQNYSHALLAYYFREFRQQKVCPRPVFYDKLKRAIKKNSAVLEEVFVFEFALLSIILPFQKYHPVHAQRLLAYIERCYRLNIKEITRKCGPLVTYYLAHYHTPSPQFERRYFTLLFEKLFELLV